jgi:hypothetical protein
MAEAFLVTDGRDVYTRSGDTLVSALREPGQGVFFYVIDLGRTTEELRGAVAKLKEAEIGRENKTSCQAG